MPARSLPSLVGRISWPVFIKCPEGVKCGSDVSIAAPGLTADPGLLVISLNNRANGTPCPAFGLGGQSSALC